jgi:sulfite exporter TauE/SafE
MVLMGLGALLILCGLLYMARATIWRGALSGRDSSRRVRDTLEPSRRGLGFLGLGANWPGVLLMGLGAVLMATGATF